MYLCTSIYTARQLSDLVSASLGGGGARDKYRMNMAKKDLSGSVLTKLASGRGLLL